MTIPNSQGPQGKRNEKRNEATLIKYLLTSLFLAFLILAFLTLIYYLLIPTPSEWPGEGEFPDNFSFEVLLRALIHHVALFPQYFTSLVRIELINYAFLTMFAYKIKRDVVEAFELTDGKISIQTYVEWAIGGLLSGIIFSAARLNEPSITPIFMILYLIVIGALTVTAYVLYKFSITVSHEGKSASRTAKTR
jgi:hypothetical protein